MKFSTSININATPDQVWSVLIDGSKYVEWDPNMISLDGDIRLGGKLKIVTKLDPKRVFKPKVTLYEANNRMVWSSGMPFGLFKGERTFSLEPTAENQVLFSLTEEFSGLMEQMISKSIPDLQPSFEAFASGLKARVESS